MKYFKTVILVYFLVSLFSNTDSAFATSVQGQLKVTIDNVLEILRNPDFQGDEKKEQRRETLSETIRQKFSFAKMSQLSLGRHWKKRSKQEKKDFIRMFGQLLEETYISKLESYTDEKVVFVKEFVRNKKAQVDTKVITESIEIPINYRMYKTKSGRWMVYDLVIERVSLVGNYRLEFDQILQKNSYEKLIEDLKKKLDK